MGINLFYICKYTFVTLLNTGELLTCVELCHFLEHNFLNHRIFFMRKFSVIENEKNICYLLVGHNVV